MRIIINKLKKVLPILAIPFFILGKCNKDGSTPCRSQVYSFSSTTNLLNAKEIYKINDTIVISSTIPKILIDAVSNEQINYSNNLGIAGNVGLILIDSINHQFINACDSFAYKTDTGSVTKQSNSNVNTIYNESNSDFNLMFKIIPLKKGNYQLYILDLGCQGIRGKNCTNASFANKLVSTDKNFQILINAAIPGVALDQFRVDHSFCFRVQ
jgi:hypothetical protein